MFSLIPNFGLWLHVELYGNGTSTGVWGIPGSVSESFSTLSTPLDVEIFYNFITFRVTRFLLVVVSVV